MYFCIMKKNAELYLENKDTSFFFFPDPVGSGIVPERTVRVLCG